MYRETIPLESKKAFKSTKLLKAFLPYIAPEGLEPLAPKDLHYALLPTIRIS